MRILITGATGLIGGHLVPALQADHEISVLTRNVSAAQNRLGEGIKYFSSLESFDNVNDIDVIINLAGEPIVGKRWSDAQKKRLQHSRWDLTEQLVSLCLNSTSPPHTFISGSAVGFYGRQDECVIDESFRDVHSEFSQQLCQTWENVALAAKTDATRVCLLRTGIVLAKDGGALAKMLLPFKLGLGGPIGDGDHYMSWIHIHDVVNAIIFLTNNRQCQGPFNLTAPQPVTNSEFAHALASVVHRPCWLTTPKMALKLAMGEMADLLIHGQNVIPAKLLKAQFTFQYPNIDQALESLNL